MLLSRIHWNAIWASERNPHRRVQRENICLYVCLYVSLTQLYLMCMATLYHKYSTVNDRFARPQCDVPGPGYS